jgi:elongation factor Ts
MTEITASLVKQLREMTDVGMMECKRALVATEGDIDAAIEYLRKNGMAKAAKKADLVAAEGAIIVKVSADHKHAAMVEVNSQTDFVARDDNFKHFTSSVIDEALKLHTNDVEAIKNASVNGTTIEEMRQALVLKIGENINVRRAAAVNSTKGILGSYVHGGRIGVLVDVEGGDMDLAKDIAMHIAATRPLVVSQSEVSPALVEKEKEIFSAQAAESGKPAEIIEKMVQGRINKFLDEVSLLGQPFVKNPDIKIEKLLKDHHATVHSFVCFKLGEGIEKKEVNFRDEVMAQVRGA